MTDSIEDLCGWDEMTLQERGVPRALAKSCVDPFDYLLKLRTGELFQYQSCEISHDCKWAHLTQANLMAALGPNSSRCTPDEHSPPFERGVDIRIDDIVWVADAAWGS